MNEAFEKWYQALGTEEKKFAMSQLAALKGLLDEAWSLGYEEAFSDFRNSRPIWEQ
jgi:hypothetical protein